MFLHVRYNRPFGTRGCVGVGGVWEIGWAWMMGWGVNKNEVGSILQKKFLLKINPDKSFETLTFGYKLLPEINYFQPYF